MDYSDRDIQFMKKLKDKGYDYNKSISMLNEAKSRQETAPAPAPEPVAPVVQPQQSQEIQVEPKPDEPGLLKSLGQSLLKTLPGGQATRESAKALGKSVVETSPFALAPKVGEMAIDTAKELPGKIQETAFKAGADIHKIQAGTLGEESPIEQGILGNVAEEGQDLREKFNEINQNKAEGKISGVESLAMKGGFLLGGGADVVGEAFTSGMDFATTQKTKEEFKEGMQVSLQKLAATKGGEFAKEKYNEIIKDYEDLKAINPEQALIYESFVEGMKGAGEVFGYGELKAGVKGATKILDVGGDIIKDTGKKAPGVITKQIKQVPGVMKDLGVRAKAKKTKLGRQIKGLAKKEIKAPEGIKKVFEKRAIKKQARRVGKAEDTAKQGRELLYEAVNPTKQETKAVLRKRVDDLVPYIDKSSFKNSLENVKGRIDTDNTKALRDMKKYESEVGVKGKLATQPIIDKIEAKYKKKIGESFIDKEGARFADDMIETLQGFGDNVIDNDIITIRRAWDKIERKNKGFMQSADTSKKGEIFGDANKFFREEIKASNPTYAEHLKKYSKTKNLSDVVGATIQRRVGQQGGGFIKRGFEMGSRITGAGLGGLPGLVATEGVLRGAKFLASPGVKLTRGAKKIKKGLKLKSKIKLPSKIKKNGVDNISRSSVSDSSIGRKPVLKKEPVIKKTGKVSTGFTGKKPSEIPKIKKAGSLKPSSKAVIKTPSLKDKLKKGDYDPILVTKDGKIIDGNHRYNTLKKMGVKNIKTSVVKDSDVAKILKDITDQQFKETVQNISKKLGKKIETTEDIMKNPEALKMFKERYNINEKKIKAPKKTIKGKDEFLTLDDLPDDLWSKKELKQMKELGIGKKQYGDLNNELNKLKGPIKTPNQINTVSENIVKSLQVPKAKAKEVLEIVKKYVKKYGAELKDKLGDLMDEIADKTGARLKFMDEGKSLDDFGEKSLIKEAKEYKSADEFVKAQAIKAQLKKDGTKINKDGTVTLYHTTTKENAKSILDSGEFIGQDAPVGGMAQLENPKPMSFFGTDKKWTKDTWGDGGAELLEVKVPAEFIRKGAGNKLEVYFEGGLKKKGDIWMPTEKVRSTFYDKIAEWDLVDSKQLKQIYNQINKKQPPKIKSPKKIK